MHNLEITAPLAEKYVANFSSQPNALLQKIIAYTNANHPKAHMLSGAIQGAFLQMMSSMIKPSNILEIGTFTGFSALCLATGLLPNGMLHTIELREVDAQTAQQFFNESEYKEHIKLHVGNAKDIIPTLNQQWDLVFIDADKTSYIEYYELTLPWLKSGAFMLIDNVLFHGEVLTENISGKNAIAIQNFNTHVANDERTIQVMLTIRDGITVIQKK